MPTLNSKCAALDRIDWNFPSTGSSVKSIHNTHWFPGNFISQIPSHLIQILSNSGDTVFDPFGGGGTTAIEGMKLGRNVISSDMVTACVFIENAKLAALSCPIEKQFKEELLARITWSHLCESDNFGRRNEGSNLELVNWYASKTLRQLRYLWQLIEEYDSSNRSILELLFSDVLFACASPGKSRTSTGKIRRHHWGWIADNVYPTTLVEHDAVAAFRERLINLPDIDQRVLTSGVAYTVIQQDARKLTLPTSSVDLIVTSPPYVGMIDYTRANRLLYAWMGWELEKDRENEIGARFKRGRKEIQQQYISDMCLCWREFARVLRPGGLCAVIIGESRKFPGTVDQTLADLSSVMPVIWGPKPRTPTRRRVTERSGTEAKEFVAVFRNP